MQTTVQAKHVPQIPSRLLQIVDWALRILLAVTYVVAGSMKLTGAEISVDIFEAIGFGHWFRYFTGVLEIVCGLLILFPRIAVWSALMLACTMVGALIAHAFVGRDAIPAAVLLLVCLVVVWMRRGELVGAFSRFLPSRRSGA